MLQDFNWTDSFWRTVPAQQANPQAENQVSMPKAIREALQSTPSLPETPPKGQKGRWLLK